MKSMEVNTSGDRSKNKAGINILIYETTYIAFKERSITRNREEWQKVSSTEIYNNHKLVCT